MNKLVKSEKGYTLFLVVLIGALFMVMATALMTLTMNGVAKNEYRGDDLQATTYSENGVIYLAKMMNEEIQETVEGGLTKEDFIKKIFTNSDSVIQKYAYMYNCQHGSYFPKDESESPDAGKYRVCIEKVEESDSEFHRKVVFNSIGIANEHEKSVKTVVEFGAVPIPDVLNYTISTFKGEDGTDGEGNLFLNGGIEIVGDLKIDGNVITSSHGSSYIKHQFTTVGSLLKGIVNDLSEWSNTLANIRAEGDSFIGEFFAWLTNSIKGLFEIVLNILESTLGFVANLINNLERLIWDIDDIEDNKWYDSGLPSVLSADNKRDAMLELGENLYTVKYPNQLNYVEHINRNTFPDNLYTKIEKEEDLTKAFKIAPEISDLDSYSRKVNIQEKLISFKPDGEQYVDAENTIFKNYRNKNNSKVYGPEKICFIDIEFWVLFTPIKYRLCSNIDTYIFEGHNIFDRFVTERNLEIIDGTTKIESGLYVGGNLMIGDMRNTNPSKANKISIDGPIYVGGDLYITGANVEFNSLIYVEGSVNVVNSMVSGLKSNEKDGVLVVFADGPISILDNTFFGGNYPNDIRGFFYSNDKTELAIKSTMEIDGGISGNRVIINSLPNAQLKINYDKEIIDTYTEFETESFIENIASPRIIDRSN